MINLYDHQKKAIEQMESGSILVGGVGSGKSLTSLVYFYIKIGKGSLKLNGVGLNKPMQVPIDLYIITTAKKRDKLEWEDECAKIGLFKGQKFNPNKTSVVIDSWQNIKKYVSIDGAFFIFDEQKLVGSGTWVKTFYKIAKRNRWILLTATPGDTWMDYAPVFIANRFYRNITEFRERHIVYNPRVKFPQILRYVNENRLIDCRNAIVVKMDFDRHTISHVEVVDVPYKKEIYSDVVKNRWDVYKNEPVNEITSLCYLLRKISNDSDYRIDAIKRIVVDNPRTIIFYNFNYELDLLREMCLELKVNKAEWNGQKHEEIPDGDSWVYLVNYMAGAEGWNCTTTNVIIFYSPNYSYKIMTQAAGRIDRLDTPYKDLYYYHIRSNSPIEKEILQCLDEKKTFNEKKYYKELILGEK